MHFLSFRFLVYTCIKIVSNCGTIQFFYMFRFTLHFADFVIKWPGNKQHRKIHNMMLHILY